MLFTIIIYTSSILKKNVQIYFWQFIMFILILYSIRNRFIEWNYIFFLLLSYTIWFREYIDTILVLILSQYERIFPWGLLIVVGGHDFMTPWPYIDKIFFYHELVHLWILRIYYSIWRTTVGQLYRPFILSFIIII